MAPVTLPVMVCGLLLCLLLERFGVFGYGAKLPERVREVLKEFDRRATAGRSKQEQVKLVVRALIGIWLVIALAFHGGSWPDRFVGDHSRYLPVRRNRRARYRQGFPEALPFTALLTVFFTVVAVIIEQHLFSPIIQFVLQAEPSSQLALFYLFNGLLSSVSDNVFVGTVYINEARAAFNSGAISLKQFEMLAVAINTGTNLPSVATPNGQAAFLFLLTSALAPLVRLSYGRMVWMALPYTVVLTLVGLLCVQFALAPMTELLTQWHWLTLPSIETAAH